MKYIDLHVHSTISDGTLTPTEVVHLAADQNLAAIALTDHDTVRGVKEALAAAKTLKKEGKFVRIIPGVEISAEYSGRDIHILGLFINPDSPELNAALDNALSGRDKRNEQMVENLRNAGIDITLEALTFGTPDTVITRAHFARYLINRGYAKNNDDAFKRYLGYDTPYYVPRTQMTPESAISLIRDAGGLPILAHPLLYKLTLDELDALIARLKSAGLIGIETIYSANTGFDEGIIRRYVNKYDLIMTGGSDFHGSNKPHIFLGTGKGNLKIPETILTCLEEKLFQLRS
ncbi:MAG: PHP domain-containing protein [Lachnospiraceae bacterium]|nr:PHP domain-containing protein [Lachnospiraceae bacterium]